MRSTSHPLRWLSSFLDSGEGLKKVLQQKIEALAAFRKQVEQRPLPKDEDERDARLSLLHLLATCHADAVRRMRQDAGDLSHLYEMKTAIREAGEVLAYAYEQDADKLKGFYHGAEPKNYEQWCAGVLNELILGLTASIVEIEAEYPEMQARFDAERAAYARVH